MSTPPEQLVCPHCRQETEPRGSATGRVVDCRHCNRSFVLPDADPSGPAETADSAGPLADFDLALRRDAGPARPLARWLGRNAPTEVSLPLSALAAAGLTGLFYALLAAWPGTSYIGELFAERGWVPYVIAWLASWAAVVLFAKWRLLRQQRESLEHDLLPEAIAPHISADNAHVFASYVEHIAGGKPDSFLCQRVQRAMRHLRARRQAQEVVDHLDHLAQADANSVESSYTMLRVFIWAIPILGFIGTVLGIGAAVSAFSGTVAAAVDLEVMKQSIGAVTLGLGVAFDTTLLALVMSILIMFPASSLQKAEEDFLVGVDRYCERRLVRRLVESGAGGAPPVDALAAELSRLSGALTTLERRLAESKGA